MSWLSQNWHIIAGLPTAFAGGGLAREYFAFRSKRAELSNRKREASDDVALTLVRELQTRLRLVEALMMADRRVYDAEMKLQRHKTSNAVAVVDAAVAILEFAPDRVEDVVQMVKERRARAAELEMAEAAAAAAAHAEAAELASRLAQFANRDPDSC